MDKSEKEKMLAGEMYNPLCPRLTEEREKTRQLLGEYNRHAPALPPDAEALLQTILGKAPRDACVMPPFFCDYGRNIEVGKGFFANFGLTVLDEARVKLGDNCLIGPNVSIYTACHPTLPSERNTGKEWALGVTIGDSCWIGGSVTILPGVKIGEGCTIGAGSVVTKDIPPLSVAVGNPCKVIKTLDTPPES